MSTESTEHRAPIVSVVVPTYRSGPGLDRLVATIDAQTLPNDRFEVIFVDDGSPDDTYERLLAIARARPNVRAHRIEHSGWPSRPRNVGIDLADGEYVLFADHDDELYPVSLETAVETLSRTGADVFAGKEARTDQAKWAVRTFDRNYDNAMGRAEIHPLSPTNPHKLYRVGMLREHGIRFPEGGRQLWEDVIFNADVARHMRSVSIRSDEPFYHWVRSSGDTTSTSFGGDVDEWWTALGRVLTHIDDALDDPEHALQRAQFVAVQFRERVLPAVGPSLLRRDPETRARVIDHARGLVERHSTAEIEASLPRHLAARAQLLRLGRPDLVESLATLDDGITGITFARAVEVRDAIELSTVTTWMAHHGGFLDVELRGARLHRRLPADVAAVLDPRYGELDDDLGAATSEIGVRSRATSMTWLAPTETRIEVDPDPDYPAITATSLATIDPERLRVGKPMDAGYWDFNARNELFGVVNHRAVRGLDRGGRFHGGRDVRVYTNIHGNLSLALR